MLREAKQQQPYQFSGKLKEAAVRISSSKKPVSAIFVKFLNSYQIITL